MELAEKIKTLRKQKGISQKELADLVGVAQASINKLEKGNTINPNVNIALKIAEVLGTDVYELFGDGGSKYVINENNQTEIKRTILRAIDMYESNQVFFKGFELNENDPSDEAKFDEFRKIISNFKTGIIQTLINVGFLSKDDIMSYISEEKGKINP